jgi:hypothetical protein
LLFQAGLGAGGQGCAQPHQGDRNGHHVFLHSFKVRKNCASSRVMGKLNKIKIKQVCESQRADLLMRQRNNLLLSTKTLFLNC